MAWMLTYCPCRPGWPPHPTSAGGLLTRCWRDAACRLRCCCGGCGCMPPLLLSLTQPRTPCPSDHAAGPWAT